MERAAVAREGGEGSMSGTSPVGSRRTSNKRPEGRCSAAVLGALVLTPSTAARSLIIRSLVGAEPHLVEEGTASRHHNGVLDSPEAEEGLPV